jgi:hypothetical protein
MTTHDQDIAKLMGLAQAIEDQVFRDGRYGDFDNRSAEGDAAFAALESALRAFAQDVRRQALEDGATDRAIAHQVRLLYQVTSSPTAANILDAADRELAAHGVK